MDRQKIIRFSTAIVTFLILAIVAGNNWLFAIESWLFSVITSLPGWLNPVFFIVMQLGALPFVLLAGVLITVLDRKRGIGVLSSSMLAWLLVLAAKEIVTRPRPDILLGEAAGSFSLANGSFPSLHAALATVLVLGLATALRGRQKAAAWVFVGIVGLARVSFGLHLPLDIIGGVILGYIVSLLVQYLLVEKKLIYRIAISRR